MANPFAHVELNTADLGKAKQFYKKLFGWTLKDMKMDGGDVYTMIDVGKGVGGGMQKIQMPGAPPMWLSYVEVDSVKKTIAKAKASGANVVVDYMPIGEMGAIGVFIDPQGAALGLWEQGAPAKKPAKKAAKKR